jgi:pentatricopeptide repeat protein
VLVCGVMRDARFAALAQTARGNGERGQARRCPQAAAFRHAASDHSAACSAAVAAATATAAAATAAATPLAHNHVAAQLYNIVIGACAAAADWRGALEVLDAMRGSGTTKPDVVSYSSECINSNTIQHCSVLIV